MTPARVASDPTATVRPSMTPAPTPSATPAAPMTTTLRFWLPDTLAGLDSVEAGDILAEQISGFQTANANAEVELRLRAGEGAAGLLEALRTTAAVAPSALPDITLLRYSDFLLAAQDNLLTPFAPTDLPPMDENYAPIIAALGEFDNQIYGVPATFDLLHLSAPANTEFPSTWNFDAVMQAELPILFPAAPPNGISDVFMLQYLAAGGSSVSADTLLLNESALRATLRFYERAVAADLIPVDVLEYDIPDRYATLINETPMIVNAHLVLQALRRGDTLQFGYVPTPTGNPITFVDGWLWVITTSDPARQQAALSFLDWMLATERQADYFQAIDRLPAATGAQRLVALEYAEFVAPLLENALIPPPGYRDGAVARALQNAYASVISGQSTANDALEAVLEQVSQ
jgi:ABC-type glycerol-3-phosphate transport system substrate-binding protein